VSGAPDKDEFDIDPEVLRKQFWGDDEGEAGAKTAKPNGATNAQSWGDPDMGVLRLHRRSPPTLPLKVFGEQWSAWIREAAEAAACPPDYVALPLLSSASALIGNARWAQAHRGWIEPPHLWMAAVGDSGDGKSPGADCLMRDVLREIEARMIGDFPERHHEWLRTVEADKAVLKRWQDEQRAALRAGRPFDKPMPVPAASDIEPKQPCLRFNDVTVEEVAAVLATGAPKGLVMTRDELAGWLDTMGVYNSGGRSFWIEAYGGRFYRVGRRKHSGRPIEILHLAVAAYGGTQPDKLAKLLTDADDGLLARFQWGWPDPVPFNLGEETPNIGWAIERLDRLRELDLAPGNRPSPILMPLTPEARQLLREFGQEMQSRRGDSGGLLRSAYGKARGTALRLSLVLEWLWWCGEDGLVLPPDSITPKAFAAAATLVADYFMPMAERVFGDAGATVVERNMATLARWILRERSIEVHVRILMREVRLPGLRTAEQIRAACDALVEADWLRAPAKTVFGQPRSRVAYTVNPKLYER
jgi:hypothetical protein